MGGFAALKFPRSRMNWDTEIDRPLSDSGLRQMVRLRLSRHSLTMMGFF